VLGRRVSARGTVQALLERFELCSAQLTEGLREAEGAHDLTTQDRFIEVRREIDRHAYVLRSHLR